MRSDKILLTACFAVLFLGFFSSSKGVGCFSEFERANKILMHTPTTELFWALIHPEAALYEEFFNSSKLSSEHKSYIELLKSNGIEVCTVEELFYKGVLDEVGNVIEGDDLSSLRNFAKDALVIDSSCLSTEDQVKQIDYKDKVIQGLSPCDLIKIIFSQPRVVLSYDCKNTGLKAVYESNPIMNLYFCRDQVITTPKGVVIGNMNSTQRKAETKIIEFVLKKMNIIPIYNVCGDAYLEGGDYIPVGDTSFVGLGMRTNEEGVRQLLDNDVFGCKRVVVVKDFWKTQEQMHLDTYFNVIRPDLAVLVDMRISKDGKEPEIKTLVDVYEKINNQYEKINGDIDFQTYLESHGYKIIPVTREDQNLYAINFLTVNSNKIYAVDGCSDKYKEALKEEGVDVTWMNMSNLTKGYGAAHCSTQVLSRG